MAQKRYTAEKIIRQLRFPGISSSTGEVYRYIEKGRRGLFVSATRSIRLSPQ